MEEQKKPQEGAMDVLTSPQENLVNFLVEIAKLMLPDPFEMPSIEDLRSSPKVRLCILIDEPAKCLFGAPISTYNDTQVQKLFSLIEEYKKTLI